MKKLMLAMLLMGMVGMVQATPFVLFGLIGQAAPAAVQIGTGVAIVQGETVQDPGLFKLVTAAHSDNPNGYTFDLTQYEYNQNPKAYVLK